MHRNSFVKQNKCLRYIQVRYTFHRVRINSSTLNFFSFFFAAQTTRSTTCSPHSHLMYTRTRGKFESTKNIDEARSAKLHEIKSTSSVIWKTKVKKKKNISDEHWNIKVWRSIKLKTVGGQISIFSLPSCTRLQRKAPA